MIPHPLSSTSSNRSSLPSPIPSSSSVHVLNAGVKRTITGEASTDPNSNVEYLEFIPLGAGCEVGRSCHILKYKNKTIMFDCGLLPAFHGMEALPLIHEVNPADIDLIFIT